MSFKLTQIEQPIFLKIKSKAGVHKRLKQQRNRLIRRTPHYKEPFMKYRGWEY